MKAHEAIDSRNTIANLALSGDRRYIFDPIGAEDADINDMERETGMTLVHRAYSDSDVAVYSNGTRHALVCDANGPISIYI